MGVVAGPGLWQHAALFVGISGGPLGPGQLLRPTTDFCLLWRIQQWQLRRHYLRPFFLLPNNQWTGVRLSVHLQRRDTQSMHLEWLLNSMVQHPNRWFWKPHKWELRRLCLLESTTSTPMMGRRLSGCVLCCNTVATTVGLSIMTLQCSGSVRM